jgi:hypothetical protein
VRLPHVLVGIAFAIGILLGASVSWFIFRPNFDKYKNTWIGWPYVHLWGIKTEKGWRVLMTIATIVAIGAALIAFIGGFLGWFE